jgi:endonuclease/exonuclease/phosphatase family metal-dependent hydrolase
MNVLTWNLFHGRSVPPSKRDLLDRFAALLAGWEWDVALLQEVPPWWPAALADAADAEYRMALTSRNAGLWLRRQVGERWPELAKSNAGGCNAILARRTRAHGAPVGVIVDYEAIRLRLWPERRVGQLVRLAEGTCVANVHASARVALAEEELERLWRRALRFANGAPLVLGGDLNLRSPLMPERWADRIADVAERDVDRIFARDLVAAGAAHRLERSISLDGEEVQLSDHIPLLAELVRPGR